MSSRTRTKRQQLSAFIAQKRATDDRSARRRSSTEVAAHGPSVLVFTPARHGLSWAQCQLATRLLARAEARRPFTGSPEQIRFRRALRIAGILSSVRAGRVGSTRWSHSMHGRLGGNVMRDHALAHLRAWSPIARLAAMMARERREAETYYESTGEVLAPGTRPPQTKEEARVRHLITQWEEAQWQTEQHDRLRW